MRTDDDVNNCHQMALESPTNGEEAEMCFASGSVFQSAIDNRKDSSCDGYLNCGFVHDSESASSAVDIGDRLQERINECVVRVPRNTPRVDLCFSRRYAGPRVPLSRTPGFVRSHPRRLWFERRHWGSVPSAPSRVQFPHRGELGQGTASSSPGKTSSSAASPPSKVVYSIGVFYSDTELCEQSPSGHKSDDIRRESSGSEITDDNRSSGNEKFDDIHKKSSDVHEEDDIRKESSGSLKSDDIPRESSDGDEKSSPSILISDDLLPESSAPTDKTYENVREPRLLPSHHKQIVVRGGSGGAMTSTSGGGPPPSDPPRRSSNSCRSTNRRPPAAHTQLTPDTFSSPPDSPDTNINNTNALPDILNSHLPPPYSTLPSSSTGGRRLPPPSHPPPPPPPPPSCPHNTPRTRGGRGVARRGGRRGQVPSFVSAPPAASESDEPKHCCGVMVTQTVSIRWFIVMIAFVGLCCAIVGTVLGALKATGREHLTVSLLMIGVGIVLITVSGIAWRLTSHDAPSCRAMLGLQNSEHEPNRRFVPRVPPYGRPTHHPYAAMMYPEFQYRPPPPSYQASMQEYRLRLLLLDRQSSTPNNAASTPSALSPVSPPPTYRSHNATASNTLHSRPPLTLTEREYSRPPSYRSRASSAGVLRPSTETLCSLTTPTQPPQQQLPTSHSRNPSLSLSFLSHESLFLDSGHSRTLGHTPPQQQQQQPHFTSPSGDSVVGGLSDESSPPSWSRGGAAWKHGHDVNAVTIVQTTDSSQVLNRDSVILSVPGNDVHAAGEVRILAHV